MDEIHEVTGMKLAELRDNYVTAGRKHWRRMVKTVARTRRVDSTRKMVQTKAGQNLAFVNFTFLGF